MVRPFRFGVIGSGRQGAAAAYWLARWNPDDAILVTDRDPKVAETAADRVNRLTGLQSAVPRPLDVEDPELLMETLVQIDVVTCAVPFEMIVGCTVAAVNAGTSMVDLGGHTETVLRQLEHDHRARAADVSIVPDCGMGPGMSNTMGLAGLERLRAAGVDARELRIWEGGLPLDPPKPYGYLASFNIEGLTNEYDGEAVFLRNGRVTKVEALTEVELLEFDGIGRLEAFVTSGGTSTLPYTLEGELEVLENKTCRYPGHLEKFRAFRELGLFSRDPLVVDGARVRPRDVYHALLGPRIHADRVDDICLIRAVATGDEGGRRGTVTLELVDRHDPHTGLTAMERLTGGHAALMACFIARGEVAPGVRTLDQTVSSLRFIEEARRRGFEITERVDIGSEV